MGPGFNLSPNRKRILQVLRWLTGNGVLLVCDCEEFEDD